MKKIFAITMAVLLMLCTLTACGNYDMFDTEYRFDKAIVEFPGGEVREIEIKQWTDYENGEQLQIIDKEGNVYVVNSVNCVLIKESK